MRIGLFSDTYPPEVNGVANSTFILRNVLKEHGHDVFVITTKVGLGLAQWEEQDVLRLSGIELKSLYGYVLTTPFHFNALNQIKELNLDLIHVQTEFGVGIFAHICSKQLGIPIISTYHTTYEDYTHYANILKLDTFDQIAKKLVARLSKLYGDSCNAVIAPSKKTKQLLERYHVRSDIHVVPTGIPLQRFVKTESISTKANEIRQSFGFSKDDCVLVYIGRIAEEKALDLVICHFSYAKKAGCQSKFLIVGDGPDLTKTKELVTSLQLDDVIKFAGKVENAKIAEYYHSGNAFVSASLTETQGMTFIEALACGLPLFARYDETVVDLVVQDETGWFFEDEESFTAVLKNFESLSIKEHQKIEQFCLEKVKPYNSETFYEKAFAVYQQAILTRQKMFIVTDVNLKGDYVRVTFTSDGESYDVDMFLDDFYEEGIRKNVKITKTQFEHISKQQDAIAAYQKCIKKITFKDRTRKEMYDFLTQQTDCSIEMINQIIERLESKGFINDERYCKQAISRMKITLQGHDKIIQTLRKKGIDTQTILNELTSQPDDELQNAITYANQVVNTLKNLSLQGKKNKLFLKMRQRGFQSDIISEVMKQLDFSNDEKNELDNLQKCALKAKKRYERKYHNTELRNHIYRYCLSQGYQSENIYIVLNDMRWEDD